MSELNSERESNDVLQNGLQIMLKLASTNTALGSTLVNLIPVIRVKKLSDLVSRVQTEISYFGKH